MDERGAAGGRCARNWLRFPYVSPCCAHFPLHYRRRSDELRAKIEAAEARCKEMHRVRRALVAGATAPEPGPPDEVLRDMVPVYAAPVDAAPHESEHSDGCNSEHPHDGAASISSVREHTGALHAPTTSAGQPV